MPTLDVHNLKMEKVGTMELSDELFDDTGSSHVVWEVVRHHLAARRRGTASTKTRGDVRGGGRKPWKQKGTGRARVGSSRNPIWRHGGITHGPHPRDYDYALPKGKRRVAARRVIASLLAKDRILVVDGLAVSEPKTKVFRTLLAGLGLDERTLVLVDSADQNLSRATSNLSKLKVVGPEGVNAYDLLRYRRLLATSQALTRLQGILSR